ncbi:MAG: galactose mutarotase [Bacteroidales bacterium]|nr:galactose mutarotase [Bacteroidales bacterium]
MNAHTTKSGLQPVDFQSTIDGNEVQLFILTNKNGCELCVTNYGAFAVSLMIPDKKGNLVDVVLGHQTLKAYVDNKPTYLGSVIGRYGNRIANGKFTLDGKEYSLAINNGPNNLHGGNAGFDSKVWSANQIDNQTLELSYVSPDGEEGFPGTLTTKMVYKLTDDNAFSISYESTTDKPTLCNLTNHAFFNLSGAGDPSICDHELQINAKLFTPTDDISIPTGEIMNVAGTPMDFTSAKEIGRDIEQKYSQLEWGAGYDHNYVIDRNFPTELILTATASSPKTGIVMKTYTDAPGVQLYTGNWLGNFEGKVGKKYPARSAFCLETQHFPDTPNKAHFPSCVLRPGEVYRHTCIYQFDVK